MPPRERDLWVAYGVTTLLFTLLPFLVVSLGTRSEGLGWIALFSLTSFLAFALWALALFVRLVVLHHERKLRRPD